MFTKEHWTFALTGAAIVVGIVGMISVLAWAGFAETILAVIFATLFGAGIGTCVYILTEFDAQERIVKREKWERENPYQ